MRGGDCDVSGPDLQLRNTLHNDVPYRSPEIQCPAREPIPDDHSSSGRRVGERIRLVYIPAFEIPVDPCLGPLHSGTRYPTVSNRVVLFT